MLREAMFERWSWRTHRATLGRAFARCPLRWQGAPNGGLTALLLAWAIGPASAFAAPGSIAAGVSARPAFPLQRSVLENGLKVVLSPHDAWPTLVICVIYDVAARNESTGQRGFAHLLRQISAPAREPAPSAAQRDGALPRGQPDDSGTSDGTAYCERWGTDDLALGLEVQAARMQGLELNAATFEASREAALEGYRELVRGRPYAFAELRLRELVFDASQPYRLDATGPLLDLAKATFEAARAFRARYYGPNNAALSIAGSFDPSEALRLVRRHFDDARRVDAPEPPRAVPSPKIEAQRALLEDQNATSAGLFYGWAIPGPRTEEHYALELAASILGAGQTSRLTQLLVVEHDWARRVTVWTEHRRVADLFGIEIILQNGISADRVRRFVEVPIAALARWGPTRAELSKAKARFASTFALDLTNSRARALALGQLELFWGDAALIESELDRYLAVTSEDVQRHVARYLDPRRRRDVIAQPGQRNPAPGGRFELPTPVQADGIQETRAKIE